MIASIKILTLIYIFMLAVIIFTADSRGTNYFEFINLLPFGDKIGHFCLMGMLSLLVNLVLQARTIQARKLSFLLGSLAVAAIVALEEFSQILMPDRRTFDLYDLAADLAGIFIGGAIACFIAAKRFRQI